MTDEIEEREQGEEKNRTEDERKKSLWERWRERKRASEETNENWWEERWR